MSVGRLIFLFQFANFETITSMPSDFLKAMILGIRFDFRIGAMAFIPLFLFLTIGFKLNKHIEKVILPYSFLIFLLTFVTTTANFFYYKTYGQYFDVFVFGLIDDDTSNVLLSIWSDYPIIKIFFSLVAIIYISTKIVAVYISRKQANSTVDNRALKATAIYISAIIALAFFARGSFGTFPLKQYHVNVSSYEVFNQSTPNGLIALSWANKKYKKNARFKTVSVLELDTAIKNSLSPATIEHLTPSNQYVQQAKPNVVLALMESMGSNMLAEDNVDTYDLLGTLRNHFSADFVFNRFVSNTNSTIDTVSSLFFHSNVSSISGGLAQKTKLSASVFLPYQQSGYKVIYITGGSCTWRNICNYLSHQGVDEVYSQVEIETKFPDVNAFVSAWGVPDDYLFKFAEHLIDVNTQPTFIVLLTQTNHSPHQIPAYYQPSDMEISDELLDKLSLKEDKNKAINMSRTFQYASSSLGDFIGKIKVKHNNTIIVATGDHRQRGYSIDYPTGLGLAYGTPLYLYVPDDLLANINHQFDPQRLGSHRDIFPTLYALSLSNTPYISLGGRNLLQVEDTSSPMAFNDMVTLVSEGVINNTDPTQVYPWKSDFSLDVSAESVPFNQKTLWKNYSTMQSLFINSQVMGFKD